MCLWIGVAPSGYYYWKTKPASATEERRTSLKTQITEIFTASRETYGYRRVHAQLARQGVACGPELVRHLMIALGLHACQLRPWRVTTTGDGGATPISDHVHRDFTADHPGVKLVGDITYIATWEGFIYLATVIDCHTKSVIGWATDNTMKTSLIVTAITMAARNYTLQPGCVFHSDRGTQYASQAFRDTLITLGVTQSMGRTGVCWDNAMAESFFAALKNELIYRTVFSTHTKAQRAIAEYIEIFYNTQRIHSGIHYMTPAEAHHTYLNTQLAA